jgi:hypothetical protein
MATRRGVRARSLGPDGRTNCGAVPASRQEPQIPKHQSRRPIDKRPDAFVGYKLRSVQHGGMGQSLDRRDQDKSGKVEIGDIDLVTMRLKIDTKQRAGVLDDRVDVLELPGASNLFIQDTMKPWVNAVRGDRSPDESARPADRSEGRVSIFRRLQPAGSSGSSSSPSGQERRTRGRTSPKWRAQEPRRSQTQPQPRCLGCSSIRPHRRPR